MGLSVHIYFKHNPSVFFCINLSIDSVVTFLLICKELGQHVPREATQTTEKVAKHDYLLRAPDKGEETEPHNFWTALLNLY